MQQEDGGISLRTFGVIFTLAVAVVGCMEGQDRALELAAQQDTTDMSATVTQPANQTLQSRSIP